MLSLSSILSSLFRLCSYIFLQIIPTRLAIPLLPVLYLLYLITACPPHSLVKHEKHTTGSIHRTRPLSPISTILFSLPTESRYLRYLNLIINTLLFLAALDFAVTPFVDTASDLIFTRVGALYPDSAKIVVRYPKVNATERTLLLVYRETPSNTLESSPPWKDGPHLQLNQSFDWVGTVRLASLWPGTSYEYILSDLNRTLLPYPPSPIQFRTFPDPRLQLGSRLRFITSSCMVPNFPYRGPFHRRTIRGYDLLATYLDSPTKRPRFTELPSNSTQNQSSSSMKHPNSNPSPAVTDFLLFLGDFIYADVPLYIGDDQEAYRRLYRRNYQSPSFRNVYEKLPIFHTYDDHEFINNYIGEGKDVPPYQNASNAYNIYNGNANYDSLQPGRTFYDFQLGDVAFFVMDTRRYRSPLMGPDLTSRTLLGSEQLSALYNWLHMVNGTCTFKFIVSSVPFTSLWSHDALTDSWSGFPAERAALLSAFHTVPNVIIISGDRHEFAAIEFNPNDPKLHTIREFSTSPLNMFYIPFIRTMRMQSEESFIRTSIDGSSEEVPYEKVLAYLPNGNSKWSTFEIDTTDLEHPLLHVETVIDGQPAYRFELIGIRNRPLNMINIGSIVVTNVKDLFDRMGIKPSRWF